jgi:mannose-6-phosphate isomerase
MAHKLYPLLLNPSLKTKVWGGRKLETVLCKELPTDEPYGESWELHDTSIVRNGSLAGQSLGDLLAIHGHDLIGRGNDPTEGFPLLAKFIDASAWLSIQVHPNDRQAQELEGEPRGKTEAWIVLYAEPDAKLVIGVEPGTSRETMAQAIRDGVLEDHVVYANVRAGDVLLLDANTVHAVGPGVVIYEIQQSSDTTYRLYDWNRMGMDGKPRELHIDKGVKVANVDFLPQIRNVQNNSPVVTLVENHYFKSNRHQLGPGNRLETVLRTNGKFHSLTCIGGEINVLTDDHKITLTIGDTCLVPAAVHSYRLSGNGQVIRSWQPNTH